MGAIAVKSIEQALIETVPMPFLAPYQKQGRIRVHKTSYITSGTTFEAGSTITGTVLPKSAKLVGGFLASEDLGTSVTLKVTINSVDILAAASHATATRRELPDAAGAIAANYADLDCGGFAPIITSAGATATAAKKILLILLYVVD